MRSLLSLCVCLALVTLTSASRNAAMFTRLNRASSSEEWGLPSLGDIKKGASNIGSKISNGASNLGNTISNGASNAAGTVKNGATNLGNTISNGASNAAGTVKNGATGLGSTIVGGATNLGGTIANGATNLGGTIANGATNAWNSVADAEKDVENALKNAKSFLDNGLSDIGNKLSGLPTTVSNKIEAVKAKAQAALNSALDDARKQFNEIGAQIKSVANTVYHELQKIWSLLPGAIVNFIRDIIDLFTNSCEHLDPDSWYGRARSGLGGNADWMMPCVVGRAFNVVAKFLKIDKHINRLFNIEKAPKPATTAPRFRSAPTVVGQVVCASGVDTSPQRMQDEYVAFKKRKKDCAFYKGIANWFMYSGNVIIQGLAALDLTGPPGGKVKMAAAAAGAVTVAAFGGISTWTGGVAGSGSQATTIGGSVGTAAGGLIGGLVVYKYLATSAEGVQLLFALINALFQLTAGMLGSLCARAGYSF